MKIKHLKKSLFFYRKRIQEINYNRKNEQTHAGSKLSGLEQT
jgi:hypothetical protein